MTGDHRSAKFAFACGMLALLLLPGAAGANGYAVVYSFAGGNDGAAPEAGLYPDSAGNLYGTTLVGGDTNSVCGDQGCGAVFKVSPDGTETVLYAFTGGNDGAGPLAGLIVDAAGNLVGTTGSGGKYGFYGGGTVFLVAPDNSEKTLYSFCANCRRGSNPYAGVIADSAGNLYGTTRSGGNERSSYCQPQGCGTVFEVTTDGKETVLHTFGARRDSAGPHAALYEDGAGNLYGTTVGGGGKGCGGYGCGTVFKVAPDGTETILHAFKGGRQDGTNPYARLIPDSAGNLYSTTYQGGAYARGTIFRIATDGTFSLLYSFKGHGDGEFPETGLLLDASGNLYGTAVFGGTGIVHRRYHGPHGGGTIFEFSANGTETVLYSFCSVYYQCTDGALPYADLTWKGGDQTALYGTASQGGANHDGVVFSYTLTPGKKK
ncbi:MAG TPA: choice-of-anchor tandem repeat GloVer-containing protein [Rhizomicrobium sp.]|jgi:uncharacterized repeat protein (TIGR03803 family)|nr:choice-of-anchor tandem repeat GloVer-containing protein [Rhizomicrobium sp.]